MAAGAAPPSAPCAEFDPAHLAGGVDALALLVWPHDQRRREEFFATSDAYLIDFDRTDLSEALRHGLEEGPRRFAARCGISVDQLRADPILERARADLETTLLAALVKENAALIRRLVEPVGRLRAVAEARGSGVIHAEICRIINDHGRRAGRTLRAVMSLDAHHPEYSASLNRAFAAVARELEECPGRGVVDADAVKKSWLKLRAVAPFWAGMEVEGEASGTEEGPEDFLRAFFGVLQDPAKLQRALRYGLAFREFATAHKPRNSPAEKVLLPPLDAFEYRVGLAPLAPPVRPLVSQALVGALDYQPHETARERAERRRGR